jgi:hypothetical protein
VSASSANLPDNLWSKMFWAAGLLLVLLLVPTFLIKLLLRKAVGDMVYPYLTYAVPCLTFLFVALLLRTWEDHGASPRRLALAWSLCTTLFIFVVFAATFYSGVELHLVDPGDAVGAFVVACVGGASVGLFITYSRVLKVTSARATKRADEAPRD